MRKRTAWLISFVLMGILAIATLTWWVIDLPLVSPLSEGSLFRFITPEPHVSNKVVYGFLPYWNLSKAQLQPELTHLAYFSLTIDADGTLITREGTAEEPGYNKLRSDSFLEISNQAQAQNTQIELVLTQMKNEDISAFLNSPAAQQKLIQSLDNVLLAYPISGINIDIEYVGSPSPALRTGLTNFMANLNQHLDTKYSHIQLSIDVYANAHTSQGIWDIQALAEHIDYLVVMAYDFHRQSSAQSGPVAPLFGGKKYWDTDISQALQAYVKLLPSEKILLGIPFYGYEWQTTSADAQAPTFPKTGSTASFDRVQELLSRSTELHLVEGWNEDALSPYLTYTETDRIYTIYYENSRSLSYKLDYVNQLDLGGIAIWALGYEGNSRELWDVIKPKLRPDDQIEEK